MKNNSNIYDIDGELIRSFDDTHIFTLEEAQNQNTSFEETLSQFNFISLIEDPLWKQVCVEVVSIMGPIAFKMAQVQLGIYSSQDKTMDLYCQTSEVCTFIQEYNYIILGSLQRYFPPLQFYGEQLIL